jgi:predicted porin
MGNQEDKQTWAIGLDHNFSRRTKIYALYTAVDDDKDDADWYGFSMGMMHRF